MQFIETCPSIALMIGKYIVEHWKIAYFPVLKMKTSSYSIVSFEDRYLLFAYTYMWQMNQKENRELDRKEGQAGLVACEERLANKRTNKSSISCSCSSSYIRATYALTRRFLFSTALLFLFLQLLLVKPLTTAKTPPLSPMPRSFVILNRWLLVVTLCLCYTGFLSFRCAGRQGRTRERSWSRKSVQQGSKNVLKPVKADYAIRGSTISPTHMAGEECFKQDYWNYWKRLASEGNRHSQPASNPKKASYLAFLIPIASLT